MKTNNNRLDLLMLPKVQSDKDVIKLERIVKRLEKQKKKRNWIE